MDNLVKYCQNCGLSLRTTSKFCPRCGQKVSNEFDHFKFCEECGTQIDVKAKYCSTCGTSCVYFEEGYEETSKGNQLKEHIEKEVNETNHNQQNAFQQDMIMSESVETPLVKQQVIPIPIIPVPTTIQEKKEENNELEVSLDEGKEYSKKDEDEIGNNANDSNIEAIVCSQCGSTDIQIINEDLGICKHCNTSIKLNKHKTINNNININVHQKNGNLYDSIGTFKIPAKVSDKDFRKAVLLKLAEDKTTPIDIFEYNFSKIKKEEDVYVYYKARVQVSYSCLVGVDYNVTYTDGNGVKQTKTETEWTPQSGNHIGDYAIAVPIDGKNDNAKEMIAAQSCIEAATNAEHWEPNIDIGTSLNRGFAEGVLKGMAESECKSKITGHHIKDFNSSQSLEMNEIKIYALPKYTIEFGKGESKPYYVSSFVTGTGNSFGEVPSDDGNITAQAMVKNKWIVFASICLMTISTLLSIILAVTTNVSKVLYIVLLFVSIAFAIVSIWTKYVFKQKIIKENLAIKQKKLLEYFSSHDLN